MREEAKHPKAVVEGHDHHPAIDGELACVVVPRGPHLQSAAVDPHEHWQSTRASRSLTGHEDVEIQAILAAARLSKHPEVGILRTEVAVVACIKRRGPGLGALRWHPAQRADGRRSKRNASPGQELPLSDPAHRACIGLNQRPIAVRTSTASGKRGQQKRSEVCQSFKHSWSPTSWVNGNQQREANQALHAELVRSQHRSP